MSVAIGYMGRDAALSDDGRYRWWLRRTWGEGESAAWIMLNPSTADAEQDDPTIRKVVRFSKRWGYGSALVFNLFALRSTDPKQLVKADDPVGEFNDSYLYGAMQSALVICAWGSTGDYASRYFRRQKIREMAGRVESDLWCLGTTKSGDPRHPLYVPYAQTLEPWL